MGTYIGDNETAKDNIRERFSRTPFVGSFVPVSSFMTTTADFVKTMFKAAIGADNPLSGYNALKQVYYAMTGRDPRDEDAKAVAEAERIQTGMAQTVYFQYYPETITDERTIEKEELTPIFLSNAIPTISGGADRTVSFKLRFSRERWTNNGRLYSSNWDKYNVDVAMAVQAIRSFVYPVSLITDCIGIIPQAVRLTLPGTKIGINTDSIDGLVTSYNVEYISFFADGQPRIADVDISFVEYPMLTGLLKNITRENFAEALEKFSSRVSGFLGSAGESVLADINAGQIGTDLVGKTKKTDVSGNLSMKQPDVSAPKLQKISR